MAGLRVGLRALNAWLAASIGVLLSATGLIQAGLAEDASTYEAWEFRASGNILAMSTIKDLSRDKVDDLVVATLDRSIYLVDGVTGKQLWNYTASHYYSWEAIASSPAVDANANNKSDTLISTKERLVMLLDGAKGKQLWAFNNTDALYRPGSACSLAVRSVHLASDINADGIADAVIISGSGDSCSQDDKFTVLALSTKTGQKLWEYVHDEDNHGLKDGTRGSSPVAIMDFNKDGTKDVAVADDQGSLHVINGLTGNQIRDTKLDVFGAIWHFIEVPDITGDGRNDALAFEFIDGAGGPDYASIDAIDLVGSRVIWQVKVGDGLYTGGALYSGAWMNDTASGTGKATTYAAVTQRIDDALDLVLLDAKTGQQHWEFRLGEEHSRNDLDKSYPVTRIADSRGQNDELAVGSIDAKLYLLDPFSGDTIWTHPINGEISGISFIPGQEGQKYILVKDLYTGVRALARQTTIETELSIGASAKTVVASSRLVVTGALSPPFPGEIVQLRYVDPSGTVTAKSLILSKDGLYTDIIEPEFIGDWKVSAEFNGEGFYLDSKSPTLGFTVVNETKTSVFSVKVKGAEQNEISYPIAYFIEGGHVTEMVIDEQTKSLNIAVAPSSADGGLLMVELPRSVIDSWQSSYQVYLDGKIADFDEIEADEARRTLSIPFEGDASQVQIIGTYVVPEFSVISPVIMAAAMVATLVAVGMRGRLNLWE